MIDKIFNKIYKHKRYLTLLENNSELDIEIEKREKIFKKFLSEIKKFTNDNNGIYVAANGNNNIVFYKSLGYINESIENITNDNDIENVSKSIYDKFNINTNDYPIKVHKISEPRGSIVQIFPFITFVIDTRNLKSWKESIIFYKVLNSTANKKSVNSIYTKYFARSHNINEIEQLLKQNFERHKELLTYLYNSSNEQKNMFNKDLILNPYNISTNVDSLENNAITIAYNNPSNRFEYRLYTSQLISDGKPRSVENCTKMLLNNCQKLETNLSPDSTNDMKRQAIKFSNKSSLDSIQLTESTSAYEIMRNNSAEDNLNIINDAYNIVKIFKEAITLADKGEFKTPYKGSAGNNFNIHIYLPEILSPYVLYWNACQWTTLGKQNGFDTLKNILGCKGNDFSSEKCYIGYYDGSTQPLADSYIWINGKFIDISTKAGLNGKGASASIQSLRKYIYMLDTNNKLTSELTFKGGQCKSYYPLEFEIFDVLSSNSKATAMDVFNILVKYNICSKRQIANLDSKKLNNFIYKTLKTSTKFASMIMEILQSASYEFVQMNCKATSTTDDFYFNYKCQYPAIFDGDVDITFKSTGFTEFHIV